MTTQSLIKEAMERKKSNEFWKDLIYTKGKLDEKKVLNELSDFYYIMDQVPKVYYAVTRGNLSKLMYPAETIIGFLEDNFYDKDITHDDVKKMIEDSETIDDLKEELQDYFVISTLKENQ